MSDTPWTPGPWDIEPHADGEKDEFYGTAIWAGPALLFTDEHAGRADPNAGADAHLIAAAPEMAELLRAIDEQTDEMTAAAVAGSSVERYQDAYERREAVIDSIPDVLSHIRGEA